jgi:hypothetical protein
MGRRLRIPFLVDLLRTQDPSEIRSLARDPRLDRNLAGGGALLNRILIARLRNILALDGLPFPAILPRDDGKRAQIQAELQARLDRVASGGSVDDDSAAAVARAVRALPGAPILEEAVQQAVGRLFVPDYEATAESWAAARMLDRAAHSVNPIAAAVWRVTGQIARAQHLLGEKVHGDRAGVHATGIAVHNLVRGFAAMRDLLSAKARDGSEEVVRRCLFAPESVLRTAVEGRPGGPDAIRQATLVVLDLGAAQQRDDSPEIVFMTGSWSQCPATAWVPAFIRAVWQRVTDMPFPEVETVGGPFRLAFARAVAARSRRLYQMILGVDLGLQLVLGIAMLATPAWVLDLVAGPPVGAGFVRLWGLLLLIVTALYAAGWLDPIYTRWPNVVGIIGRFAAGLLYLCLGGRFLWLALFDASFAAALAWTYGKALTAELMTRP